MLVWDIGAYHLRLFFDTNGGLGKDCFAAEQGDELRITKTGSCLVREIPESFVSWLEMPSRDCRRVRGDGVATFYMANSSARVVVFGTINSAESAVLASIANKESQLLVELVESVVGSVANGPADRLSKDAARSAILSLLEKGVLSADSPDWGV